MTTDVADKVDEVTFFFRPDLEERYRIRYRSEAFNGWPNATVKEDSFSLPLTRFTQISYSMGHYWVQCLKRPELDQRKRESWEYVFHLPMCVIDRIEHRGKEFWPEFGL